MDLKENNAQLLEGVHVRPFRSILLGLFTTAFLYLVTGCATLGKGSAPDYYDAPQNLLFAAPSLDPKDPATFAKWSGPVSENDKIRYLLDRIADCNYRFIRNGEVHDGKVARRWLLYKMTHWVEGVNTAQDFVTRVADRSQKTGKPYLVEFPDGRVYSLKSVFANELNAFETGLAEFRKIQQAPVPTSISTTSAPVSFSPTAARTTAVAATTS